MDKKRPLKKPVTATFKSASSKQTEKIGQKIALGFKPGDVVALFGDLGAGKTTLVKGIAKGLGVRDASSVSSPTFALIHEYRGRLPIFHLDWYRLEGVKDADFSFAQECFEANGITLVEWAGKGRAALPRRRIEITIKHMGENHRMIEVTR